MSCLRFDVNRNRIRTRFEKTRQVVIGMLDHEVNIQGKVSMLLDGRDQSWPEGNIINEMAVHNVKMQPIRARFLDGVNLGFEMGEIGCEDGWSDENSVMRHKK